MYIHIKNGDVSIGVGENGAMSVLQNIDLHS